jgi:penicillin-binding protein 1A
MSESERANARPAKPQRRPSSSSMPPWALWVLRSVAALLGIAVGLAVACTLLVAIALSVAYPNLPEISGLNDYRPKLPMRVYSADNILLGEFGEERRNFLPISKIPKVMQDAVLAIEDARFYQHPGVDYIGVIRAGLANFGESQRSRSRARSTKSCSR